MAQATRRNFLKTSSAGAAALGVLSVLPKLAFAQDTSDDSTDQSTDSGPASSPAPMSPAAPQPGGGALTLSVPLATAFTVYVADPTSGQAVIYTGEREIPLTNPSLVQSLQQAMG